MEVGLVRSIDIDNEMQQAYLDYAMSVIVARALPDARDGLKPVHRRILYAMYDMGLRPDSQHKKSARIVGEVLGKYHPHGDMAVYEAMARMAQDFSMRYMLIDGQGNFGSVDGDPPAAMRYTEARMAPPAIDMLADIQKNTVDFNPNFDGSLSEPQVLPSAIPNLLVNGATGIAVGMSTNIPPHNLGEVVDALKYMLEHWDAMDDITVENLMQFIKGPDFPTGGLVVQCGEEEDLTSAYGSGRGRVTVQARAHIEEMERGRSRIIVTELPYMTNKSSLIERIADLAREERLEGIADLRDESDRHGLRIVIELSKTAEPQTVLQALYKLTPMRSTFSIIMLALVEGEPRLLSLKQALRVYLDHRLVVVKRRAQYDLERAKARAHILEGLRVALKNLDAVIDLIRKAPDAEAAKERLMKKYKLSDIQAQAILDMPLRRLAALERKKIEEEYKEVKELIKDLEGLLRSPKRMRETVASELTRVKDAYDDRRRTHIIKLDKGASLDLSLLSSDLTPERAVWAAVSPAGLIYRTPGDVLPAASGRETPLYALRVNTRDTLFLVAEDGEAAGVHVDALPETEDPAMGATLFKVSALGEQAKLAALFSLPAKEQRAEGTFVFSASRQGMVKKTAAADLPGPSSKTFTLMKIGEGDRLGWVRLTHGSDDIFLATESGMAIRFTEEDVRPMGLVAGGVGGIKLSAQDALAGLEIISKDIELLFVTSDGKAKRVPAAQFPVQGRYGQGVLAWKLPRVTSLVGVVSGQPAQHVTLFLDKLVPKVLRFDEAPLQARAASGKTVVDLKAGDRVTAISLVAEKERAKTVKEKAPFGDGSAAADGNKVVSAKKAPAKTTAAKATPAKKETAKKTSAKAPAKAAAKAPALAPAKAPAKAAAKAAAKAPAKVGTKSAAKATSKPAAKPTTPIKTKAVEKKTAPKQLELTPKEQVTPAKTVARPKTAPGSTKTASKPLAAKTTPAKSTPAKPAPAKTTPSKPAPAKSTPAKANTAKATPAKPAAKPAAKKPAPKTGAKSTTGKKKKPAAKK